MKPMLRAALFATVLALAGCETFPQTQGPSAARAAQATPAEQELQDYSGRYMLQGAIVGCGIGAVIGMVVENNTGDGDIKERDVLGACAAGAAFGAVGGRIVASRQKEYANTQQATEAAVTAANQELAEARHARTVVQTAVADNIMAINSAKAQLDAGAITQAQYEDELAYARSVASNIERSKTGLQSEIKAAQAALDAAPANDPNRGKLASTITDLQNEYNAVDDEYQKLAQVLAQSDVGRA